MGLGFILGVTAVTALTATPAEAADTQYFVDCAAGSDSNSGADSKHPWRTLAKVNALTLGAGDEVAFRSGTTCTGTLTPHGSGTADLPIILRSYGTGNRPQIAGAGARAAILLRNVQGYTIKNLDVTNTGAAPGADQQRVGIYVLLEDYGIGADYRIANVSVHDVNGCDCRYPNPSGGIVFDAAGATTPTGFREVTVTKSTATHVDRTGIGLFSSWQKRAGNPTGPGSAYVPLTDVSINNNQVKDAGGDGVVLLNGVSAVVRDNVVDGFNTRSPDYNLGMYAWNSDDTKFRNNFVSNGFGVGIGYGIEAANFGTVFEYNYSSNNAGGFMFICASDGSSSADDTVRYNISVNDGSSNPYLGVFTLPCGPQPNTQIYNNTVYAPAAPALVLTNGGTAATWTNNIFVGQPAGSTIADPAGTYDHNLFHRVTTPPVHQLNGVTGDPRFVAPGTTADGMKLRTGSPALGAGVKVKAAGGQDYFGNPLPSSGLNIGAYQDAGL
ncbi:right-handed parallel beta-helix repeat-containing protein [Actinoplanes siamensis]|nr:right-handed parallel beta-helix repeat-containing protein [Actinoplanes siamensis]